MTDINEKNDTNKLIDIHQDLKKKLITFIELNKIPHIIFYGDSGSGKRYILDYFINRIYTPEEKKKYTMYVNCAHSKGIKFIREDLKFFAKTNLKNKFIFKSIILFNANHLTIDAQSALRRCIEEYSHTTRVFIIINNKDKLLKPILSRFCIIYIPNPIINGKRKNLYTYNHERYRYIKEQKNEKHIFLKKMLKKISMLNIVNTITLFYKNGYNALDLIDFVKTTQSDLYLFLIYINTIRKEFRNEKLLMFFIIYFVYLRKDLNFKNILSM
jgi:DNA polymerase III delta prime subunit